MSKKGPGRIFGWLAAVALGIGAGYLIFSPSEESIAQAASKGHVAVELHADDETSATFSVRKLSGASGKLTVVIPAGTPIRNSNPDGQWLITARQVVVHLSDGMPEVDQQIETYCAHQFAIPPNSSSQLGLATSVPSYSGGGGGVVEEELEPLHKLASCLSEQSAGRGDRELAVWMVADGRTGKSYEEVRDELRSQFRKQARADMQREMRGDIREKMRQQFPKLSEDRLQQEVDYYLQNTLERRIAEQAEEKVTEEIKGFINAAKPLLERCGGKTSEMRFFQTAPQTVAEAAPAPQVLAAGK